MKKDRNSFFSEYGYNQSSGFIPNQNMNMLPNQTVAANSNFYIGPTPNYGNNVSTNMYSDIDARMAKIERELNRLETRVSRLEGDNKSTIDDINISSNMYMV